MTSSPPFDEAGQIKGSDQPQALDISGDLTAQKATERPLSQVHLLDMMGDAVIALDLEGRVIHWNRFAEQLYGWTQAEAHGKKLAALIVPREERGRAGRIWQQIKQGQTWAGEFLLQRRDGNRFPVTVTHSPLYDEAGALFGFVGISKNVSERKPVEARLRESEERFRFLVDSVQDYAIYMLDPDGYVISWNCGAQRLEGYSEEEIIGRHFSLCFLPEDIVAGKPQMALDVAACTGRFEEDGWHVRKSGERFWGNVVITAMRDEQEQLHGFSKVTRDITEHKRIKEELERSNREILTIWDSMTDAFFALDHDFNIMHVNEQACVLWKQKREDVVGKNLEISFPQTAQYGFFEHYARALREQIPVKFEEFYPPLGTWYEIHAYPSSLGLSIYFRDITQRKVAEHAISQSEARFQSILANAPGMVYRFVLKPDGTTEILFVNDGSRRLLEMTPDEVRSSASSIAQIIHPDDLVELEKSVRQSAVSLSPWEWEGRLQLPSGTTKWVQSAARSQRLPDGGTLWDGLLSDISERKRAEEERDRFFTLSLDLLCIADERGFFRRLNPAFEETLGYSQAELMSRSFLELVHPDDQDATRAELQSILRSEPTLQFVNRFRCRDGSYKWLSWRSKSFEGLSYAAARDITALKQAEDELYQSNVELERRVARRTAELACTNDELHLEIRERQRAVEAQQESFSLLQAVIEGSTDCIFVKDLEGRYLMINSAGARRRRKTVAEIVGQGDADLFSSETASIIREADQRILASNSTQTFEEITVEDGVTRIHLVTKGPHLNPRGEVIGIVGIARDITASKQQEGILRVAKEDADAANRAKSEFLSRMSHELRTPLNAILGFGQILEMGFLGAEERAAVTQILKGGWHLLDLVNEVLDISRVEAGHLDLSLEPIALADVMLESCALVRPLADQREISLEESEMHACGYHVLADQQRLKQVLINLLSNAIKYNIPGGQVEVSCGQTPNGCIRIAVRDTGPGIPARDQDKAFAPFERLNAANSKIEGSGLGLALSQKLIQEMGGAIGVESTQGKGSTFWVELPEAQAPLESHQQSQVQLAEPRTTLLNERAYTLLSIEDNLSNLWLLEAILVRRPAVTLLSAMQGSIGLDLARQHAPDLILLDLNLPDLSGAQVLEQLQSSPETAHIPVIVVSADATPTQIERLLRAGARDYLTKPLNVAQFLRTLDETLELVALPAQNNAGVATTKTRPLVRPARSSAPLSILVVEDNSVNQQIVLHQLQNLEHKVSVVDNGEAAIEAWEKGDFDLILLDCHLPGMDGCETAREIRRRENGKNRIPIIALTATGSASDRNRCLAAGMDDYLSKPVKSADLAFILAQQTYQLSSSVSIQTEISRTENQTPVLERERWEELQTELEPSDVQKLVFLFLQETTQLLSKIQSAMQSDNFIQTRQLAHNIKGSCSTIGLMRMVEQCRGIELSSSAQDKESIEISLNHLFHEFDTAKSALQDEFLL